MQSMASYVEKQDWDGMNMIAQQLKMSSAYVGAGKLTYACYYLQEAYINPSDKNMLYYYPLLVEAVIEFKRYIRQYLADTHGKKYSESQSVTNIPLVQGYALQYNIFNNTYFCLKADQTINQRLEILKSHAYKPQAVYPRRTTRRLTPPSRQ